MTRERNGVRFGRRPTSGFQGKTPHISIVPARCGVLHRELISSGVAGGREGGRRGLGEGRERKGGRGIYLDLIW